MKRVSGVGFVLALYFLVVGHLFAHGCLLGKIGTKKRIQNTVTEFVISNHHYGFVNVDKGLTKDRILRKIKRKKKSISRNEYDDYKNQVRLKELRELYKKLNEKLDSAITETVTETVTEGLFSNIELKNEIIVSTPKKWYVSSPLALSAEIVIDLPLNDMPKRIRKNFRTKDEIILNSNIMNSVENLLERFKRKDIDEENEDLLNQEIERFVNKIYKQFSLDEKQYSSARASRVKYRRKKCKLNYEPILD